MKTSEIGNVLSFTKSNLSKSVEKVNTQTVNERLIHYSKFIYQH